MNRAERRRKVRQINTPAKIEQFSGELESRLRRYYEEQNNKRLYGFIKAYTILTAYVLNDELNLGPKRLPKIMGKIRERLDDLGEDYFTINELEDWLRTEKHIKFTWGDKGEMK